MISYQGARHKLEQGSAHLSDLTELKAGRLLGAELHKEARDESRVRPARGRGRGSTGRGTKMAFFDADIKLGFIDTAVCNTIYIG